jgi:hypothetical protein
VDRPGAILEYVRSARRVRAGGRRDCAQMHASLRRLSRPAPGSILSPASCRREWSRSPILGHRGPAARQFARRVSCHLIGGLLPWTDRRILLKEAASLGIGRFDANLIIAAVQHETVDLHPNPLLFEPEPQSRRPEYQERGLKLSAVAAPIATFLLLQLVIIATVWRLLF